MVAAYAGPLPHPIWATQRIGSSVDLPLRFDGDRWVTETRLAPPGVDYGIYGCEPGRLFLTLADWRLSSHPLLDQPACPRAMGRFCDRMVRCNNLRDFPREAHSLPMGSYAVCCQSVDGFTDAVLSMDRVLFVRRTPVDPAWAEIACPDMEERIAGVRAFVAVGTGARVRLVFFCADEARGWRAWAYAPYAKDPWAESAAVRLPDAPWPTAERGLDFGQLLFDPVAEDLYLLSPPLPLFRAAGIATAAHAVFSVASLDTALPLRRMLGECAWRTLPSPAPTALPGDARGSYEALEVRLVPSAFALDML